MLTNNINFIFIQDALLLAGNIKQNGETRAFNN